MKATEVIMCRCHVCGSTEGQEARVHEVFHIDGQFVLVENIPAVVSRRCGETIFSRETTESMRQLVRGGKPIKSVRLDVFADA